MSASASSKILISLTFALLANALEDSIASKMVSLSIMTIVVIISILFVEGVRSDFCHQSCTEETEKYDKAYFWFIAFYILVASFFLWWMGRFRHLPRQGNSQNQAVFPTIRNQVGKTCLIVITVLISYWDEGAGGYARAGLLQLFGSIDSFSRTVIKNIPVVAAFSTNFQAVLANCSNVLLPVSISLVAQLSHKFLGFFAGLKFFQTPVLAGVRLLAVVYQVARALAEFSVLGLLINNWKICITCWCIGLICSFQDENLPYPNHHHLGLPGL
jgi:hypothetical protein